jgi:hypothetical protein
MPAIAEQVDVLMMEFVNTMIREGTESKELDSLLDRHRANTEFVMLAKLARRLKRSAKPDAVLCAAGAAREEDRAAPARQAAGG